MNKSLDTSTLKNLETFCAPKTVQKIRQIYETSPEAEPENTVEANQDNVGKMLAAKIPPHIVLYIKTGNLNFLENPNTQKALAHIKRQFINQNSKENGLKRIYNWEQALLSFTMEDVKKMMAITRIN